MTVNGWVQIASLALIVALLTQPLGRLHGARLRGRAHLPLAGASARSSAASTGSPASTSSASRTGLTYTVAMLLFSVVGLARCSTRLQRLQGLLPLNPQGFGAVAPDLAFNTAVSFITNTNWQTYGGETTHELSRPRWPG